MKPPLHFSPSMQAGGLVFVSGQLGFDADGRMAEGVAGQTTRCLENMADVLGLRGLAPTDVVKTTAWLRHEQDFAAFNAAYAAFFGEHRPARSTVVCALARPEALVEIEAIAHAAGGDRKAAEPDR